MMRLLRWLKNRFLCLELGHSFTLDLLNKYTVVYTECIRCGAKRKPEEIAAFKEAFKQR